jgi:hypothetical protein
MTEKGDRTPSGVDVRAFLDDPNVPEDAKRRVRKAGQITVNVVVTTDPAAASTPAESELQGDACRLMQAQVLIEKAVMSGQLQTQSITSGPNGGHLQTRRAASLENGVREEKHMKTQWSDAGLRRLFDRYNQKFWRGKLRGYTVGTKDLSGEGEMGVCDCKRRTISIDVAAHRNDREVRATLLHEMAHAAAPNGYPAHGYPFWGQLEMLLKKGAPVSIGFAEAGSLVKTLNVPRRFKLCRKLAEGAQAKRTRQLERKFRRHDTVIPLDLVLQRFEDAASEVTWKVALMVISQDYGMLDVGHKPLWSASFLKKAQRVFARTRRDHLEHMRRRRERGIY